MTARSLYDDLAFVNALAPVAITTAAKNTGNVSLAGFNGAEIGVFLGAIEGISGSPTPGSIVVNVQHSDDNGAGSPSSYSNVAQADIVGATVSSGNVFTFDEDNVGSFQCSYVGDKYWIKITVTPTSLGAGGPISIVVAKHHARHRSVQETQAP